MLTYPTTKPPDNPKQKAQHVETVKYGMLAKLMMIEAVNGV
jgi:hypothetical protein